MTQIRSPFEQVILLLSDSTQVPECILQVTSEPLCTCNVTIVSTDTIVPVSMPNVLIMTLMSIPDSDEYI